MPEVPPNSTPGAAPTVAEEGQVPATGAPNAAPSVGEPSAMQAWVVASHEALFGETAASRCDACGEAIEDEGAGEGEAPGHERRYGLPGRGVYLSTRGGEAHLESVPLCAACASAIGMTALARWEIEEEEG